MDVAVTADAGVTATAAMPPAGAVVLEAKEIAAHGQVALPGALALAPGVSFARVGQRNETTVYVRGFDNRQVPVFVDGIPVYTPYDGYADLERFTTFDMAELQVSKGFTSVIYGANTLGGAINVVSRRPATRLEGTAGFFAGTGESASGYVNLGTRAASWYLQGGASYLTADQVRMSADFAPAKYEDGGARENSYRHDGKFNGGAVEDSINRWKQIPRTMGDAARQQHTVDTGDNPENVPVMPSFGPVFAALYPQEARDRQIRMTNLVRYVKSQQASASGEPTK
jgi:outer membrane cobalamin receptor